MKPLGASWLVRGAIATLSFCSAQALSAETADEAPKTQFRDALRLLDIWLDAQAAFDRVPAVSAGVVIGKDLVWSKGYGSIDELGRVPASADTIYSICSISKLFTSVAIMQLWEAGKLSLDDDISRHVPAFSIARTDKDSGPITIRSLLTHSSGLPRESAFGYWNPPDFVFPGREEMLGALARQRTFMRTTDHYQYSNLGMALLGEVISSVSGVSYADYVQRNILAPLQLGDTRTQLPTSLLGTRLATGHSALKRDGTREIVKPFDVKGLVAAAGFTSTVNDLAKFAAWQLRLHKAGGSEVLRVSTLREMHRIQWTDPDGRVTWGLGFAVTREGANNVVSHSGHCPGYRTALAIALKDEVAVIALANANSAGPYTKQMRQLVLKGLKLPIAKEDGSAPRLESYFGYYRSLPWSSEEVIVPWGNQLAAISLPSNDPADDLTILKHVTKDTFRAVRKDDSLGAEVVFERDASGEITGFTRWSHFVPRIRH